MNIWQIIRDAVLVILTPLLVATVVAYAFGEGWWTVTIVIGGWIVLFWYLTLRPALQRLKAERQAIHK